MSGSFLLDWATLAVSLFNAMLLLWLGLTVLLNAEPHTWGIWLAGGGLLIGAAFFLIHSVILGLGFAYISWPSDFWWYSGWIPVILAPFAWYVVMLWYTGYWEGRQNAVRLRHRFWLGLLSLTASIMVGMFLFANPLPSFGDLAHLKLRASPSFLGIPLIIWMYPPFILACIVLSMDALLRPGPTIRMMGQLARQRARPWLAAASGMLLLVSLLVGGFMTWVALNVQDYTPSLRLARGVGWLDLGISVLIAASVLLTGQAIVAYEVFTGKALPRRGLRRYWGWALALAGGYSLFLSLAVTLRLPVVYSAILSSALLALLLVLSGRRAYTERDDFITALRPFVASQRLYDHLQAIPDATPVQETETSFKALCAQVLGTRWAYLKPVGPLASLFGSDLAYPKDLTTPHFHLTEAESRASADRLYFPVVDRDSEHESWAIPLWNSRGCCGVLLVGEKQDGGLYTQEEMEVARSAGERLMDLQVSAEITRRLAALQRRQLVESQVLDRRTRRVLHDEVLPRLHAVLLDLSAPASKEQSPESLQALSDIHRQIANLLHDIPAVGAPQVKRYGLIEAIQRVTSEEFKGAFDQVNWQIEAGIETQIASLPDVQAEVIYHAAREVIRNAARHAHPAQDQTLLCLQIDVSWKDGLEILIEDNGAGIASRLAMTSAEEDDGSSGQGLALHSTLLAVIGGALAVESKAGQFTRIRLFAPAAEPGFR